jgi:hypothetical protein
VSGKVTASASTAEQISSGVPVNKGAEPVMMAVEQCISLHGYMTLICVVLMCYSWQKDLYSCVSFFDCRTLQNDVTI